MCNSTDSSWEPKRLEALKPSPRPCRGRSRVSNDNNSSSKDRLRPGNKAQRGRVILRLAVMTSALGRVKGQCTRGVNGVVETYYRDLLGQPGSLRELLPPRSSIILIRPAQ